MKRRCHYCNKERKPSDFYKTTWNRCKICVKLQRQLREAQEPEKYKELAREHRRNYWANLPDWRRAEIKARRQKQEERYKPNRRAKYRENREKVLAQRRAKPRKQPRKARHPLYLELDRIRRYIKSRETPPVQCIICNSNNFGNTLNLRLEPNGYFYSCRPCMAQKKQGPLTPYPGNLVYPQAKACTSTSKF